MVSNDLITRLNAVIKGNDILDFRCNYHLKDLFYLFYLVLYFLLWFTLSSSRSKILINLALFPTPSKMVAENLLRYLHTV